jgi:DNA (cytosine-5)-methyltransferase 1
MEFVRLVAELQPRAVLLENVLGLLTLAGGYYFDRLVTGLERVQLPGGGRYNVEFEVLNAAEHGVPQLRRRLFVVAMEPDRSWKWPTAVSAPGDITLWDAIADLPEETQASPGGPPPYGASASTSYARSLRRGTLVLNHHTKRLEELRLRRLAALKPGQDRRHLPADLQAGGHETKYRRLHPEQPCPTVTAHMGKDLSDFIHPYLNRTLTVREAARVQGFPDDYEFLGSVASQFTQVGNAVPVPLARALGLELAGALHQRRRLRSDSAEQRRMA